MTEHTPSRFRITVLGPFEAWRDDRPLGAASWQRSVQTLLKLLVTSPQRRRLRDEVIDTLWPDATSESGANNLRYALSVLRRHLGGGEPAPISTDRTWIALNPAYRWAVDLARFEELAPDGAGDDVAMKELAELYRAEPLIEDRYEDWAAPLRVHIQRTWIETCRRHAEILSGQAALDQALIWLDRALEVDPLDEDALAQVLRLLVDQGRRGEAMRRFQEFERRLRSELGVEPSPETRAPLSQAREWREEPTGQPVPALLTDVAPRPDHARPQGAYLGAMPTMPLVARKEELSRVLAGVDAAMDGRGRLMLLAGEPGVGKTRLAQEVTTALHARGFTVVTGRCYEPESGVPYYPFLDVLAELTRIVPQQLREEIPHRWPYLVRLVPDLQPEGMALPSDSREPPAAAAAGIIPSAGQDEPLLIRAVAGFLTAAAVEAPLAILLDDLHWSDSASVKLLLHLARHSGGQRLFLLGTYRDLDVRPDHPLHGAVIDLGRERLMEKIALTCLDAEGTEALIMETLGGDDVQFGLVEIIHGPADGNPFFVGEIVRSMVEEGELFRRNGAWEWEQRSRIRVPESVRAVLGQRLSRLSESTRAVLGAASVLGQTFRFDEVQRVSGLSESETEEALDEAARVGLVRETGADIYAFSHALAHGAVYEELMGRRQRRLHLAAAEAVESGPERERRAAEIALHFIQAGHIARAVPYAMLAGDAARDVFAHTEAERYYRSALDISRQIGHTAQEATTLERLADTLFRQARFSEAQHCAREAAQLFRSLGNCEGELLATCRLAETLQAQGKHQDALEVLYTFKDAVGIAPPSPGLVQFYVCAASVAMELGQYEELGEMALKAVEIAGEVGDEALLTKAQLYRHGALWFQGQPNDAFTGVKAYVRVLEEQGDLAQLAELTTPLAVMAMLRGELSVSRAYGEQAVDLARRVGDSRALPGALAQLGFSLFLLGDWQAARAHYEQAIEMSRPTGSWLDGVLCNLGHLTVCEGDWDEGQALLHEAIAVAEGRDTRGTAFLPHMYLANLDLMREQPQAAIQRLLPFLDRSGYEELWATPLLPPLAHAYLDLGDVDRAELLVRDGVRRAEGNGNRLDVVAALLVQAGVREKQGRVDDARGVLQDVLRHARDMSFPAAEAEALFALGSLEMESGDTEAARSHVTRARELWERVGARKDVERADRALAILPPSPVDT